MASKYNEDNIHHYEGLEGVRKRPAMYLGPKGTGMVENMLDEIIDNSADEYGAGRNNSISVVLLPDKNTYMVADEAQGIPVGRNAKAKMSTLTLIFTKLHAGGKFNNDAYKSSAGTHGVGAAVTNACSESFNVYTYREGVLWHQSFEKGNPTSEVVKAKSIPVIYTKHFDHHLKKGSLVIFTPDQSIISSDSKVAYVSSASVRARLKTLAMLNKNLTVSLTSKGITKTYVNKVGIKKVLLTRIKEGELEVLSRPILFENEFLSVALQYTSYTDTDGVYAYVSSKRNKDGGTHLDELNDALTKSLQIFKGPKDKFVAKDLRLGLIGVINFKMSEPEFSAQVKDKLISNLHKQVFDALLPEFTRFFGKNKSTAKSIIRRACESGKAKANFNKLMSSITNIKKGGRGALLPTVLAASKCSPDKRELYAVEGDSAAGTAKKARDVGYQEVIALTGKITNAIRARLSDVLKSKTVQNTLIALGYDHKHPEPHKHLRVQRLYFLSDADPDGSHINALLACLIYRLIPQLYEEGRVFVCDAPLYSSFYKGTPYFGNTFAECRKALPKAASSDLITRAKGWGELTPEMLEIIAFDPATRNVIQLQPVKGKDLDYFLAIMGKDSAARKILLGV